MLEDKTLTLFTQNNSPTDPDFLSIRFCSLNLNYLFFFLRDFSRFDFFVQYFFGVSGRDPLLAKCPTACLPRYTMPRNGDNVRILNEKTLSS